MIPRECKRLAEVDFPIAEVSRHSAREKSIRHGHPSTLHLWWARRPLAACRAMLMALLLPDPSDRLCPPEFKQEARDLLARWRRDPGEDDAALRKSLLDFIAEFANWDNAAHPMFLEVSRGLVKAANDEEPPLVVDPFAGGGSIPLEALRLGCETFASDLNPVACLILKVMLEDIPRHGTGLADELRRVGAEIMAAAEQELAEFYPPDPDGARPIAYLWARTVRCEAPNCGAEIPLIRSFWLARRPNHKRALRHKVVRPANDAPSVELEIFEPASDDQVPKGTVTRAKATCIYCNNVLPPERVRTQLSAQRGGADVIFDGDGDRTGGARMLAVVTLRPGETGRHYRLPLERDYEAVWKAKNRADSLAHEILNNGLSVIPDEAIPRTELRRISIPLYGCEKWSDAYTSRQLVALNLLRSKLDLNNKIDTKTATGIALGFSRLTNAHTGFSRWHQTRENIEGIFSRQAVGMVWDFCEGNPISRATGSLNSAMEWVVNVIERWPSIKNIGQVELADSTNSPLPDASCQLWFTDPPYYDSVPYAHLSDLFYIWLKRILGDTHKQFFRSNLTNKEKECVVDRPHSSNKNAKDSSLYESRMALSMSEGRRVLHADGIGCIVFAHASTEGWESLIGGILKSKLTITASWPVATEMATRTNARDTAALATSVHLVCRPRIDDETGDWARVLTELPHRVGDWMERLQGEGVRGADLVFACIGPALEIFSRYARVETADGRDVGLPEYLEKVWEVVGRLALEQVLGTAEAQARNGLAGALEEDARLTALFLWTIQSTEADGAGADNGGEADDATDDDEDETPRGKAKGYSLAFDVARRFAQPLGIHLPFWEGRIIETSKGVVRLMAVTERGQQLFGQDGARAVAANMERSGGHDAQLALFPDEETSPRVRGRGRRRASGASPDSLQTQREATTLDRIHAAMLFQSGGQANALRALLRAEQERGPDFLRLANALTALYPRGSEEKRLLDAMLLAVPR